MMTTLGFLGCLSAGPATVPTPQFTSANQTLATATAGRIQANTFPSGPTSPLRVVSLPESLRPDAPSRPWRYIVVHHSATSDGNVESIDSAHRKLTDSQGQPWLGVGYHFVVGNGHGMDDGELAPTFRWQQQIHGAHAGSRRYNDQGIGICLVGNFDTQPPTPRQLTGTKLLLDSLMSRYRIPPEHVLLHSDVTATRCPGRLFSLEGVLP